MKRRVRMSSDVFRPIEWLALLVVLSLLLLAMLMLAVRLNGSLQARTLEAEGQDIVSTLGARIGEMQALMTSVTGMHYASDGFRETTLTGFAAPLQARTPHVSLLGQFGRVRAAERLDYEESMAKQGLYRYAIQQFEPDGALRYDTLRDTYYPVSALEPLTPATLGMVGINLGAISGFRPKLEQAAASARPFLTQVPTHWSRGGQLLLVQPIYRGQREPLDVQARRQQADGGYWLSVDTESLVQELLEPSATQAGGLSAPLSDRLGLQLRIREGNQSRVVLRRTADTDEDALLDGFHAPRTITGQWTIGSSRLELTVTGNIVMGRSFAALTICGLLTVATLYALAVLGIYRRRLRESRRWQQEQAAFQERERAERTLNAIVDVVLSLDNTLCLLHMNPAAERLTGVMNDVAVGQPLSSLLDLRCPPPVSTRFDLAAALTSLGSTELLSEDVTLGGDTPSDDIVHLSIARTLDSSGESSGFIMVLRDVSVERKLSGELAYQANHDPLTGCFNRYHFEKRLTQLIDEQSRSDSIAALLYMDLDQFKVINDTCGHTAGDRLLIELTEMLGTLVGTGDVLARLGGDEFGLLIQGRELSDTHAVAERVFQLFQRYVFTHEKPRLRRARQPWTGRDRRDQ